MTWDTTHIPSLTGKVAIVTGASSGLGASVATALAEHGAHVILASRAKRHGEAAASPLRSVRFEPLDLTDLGSIRDFGERVSSREPRIDILVNNAGLALVPDLMRTTDGFELQMGTNYFGHFALTSALLPALVAGSARVVSVGSIAGAFAKLDLDNLNAEKGYGPDLFYSRSKLAVLLFAAELARRAQAHSWPITSVAAHPGVARSNLMSAGPRVGHDRRMALKRIVSRWFIDLIAQSTAAGAAPVLRAATACDVRGGEYYGPAGWAGMRGAPTRVSLPPVATNPALAAGLWEASTRLTGARWSSTA